MSTTTAESPLAILSNYHSIRNGVLALRAINHKLRSKMLDIIAEDAPITVTDLYIKMRIEQSVCSQHLSILKRAGLVSESRDGKFHRYEVNFERVKVIQSALRLLEWNPGKS